MDERILQFRVGVMILAALLIGATLALWFGDGIRSTYTIYLKYPLAPGVSVDTPVRKNGVRIGRVAQVDLLDDGVLLTVKIDEGRVLRTSETPRLTTASLLGDPVVEFVPKNEQEMPSKVRVIRDGETLSGGFVSRGPAEVFQLVARMEGRIDAALGAIETAGNRIAELSQGLTTVVDNNDERLQAILAKSDEALSHFNRAMASVDGMLGDHGMKAKLERTLDELPPFLAQAHQTLADARRTLASVQQASQRAHRNLENLEALTGPLGQHGDQLAASIQRSVNHVEELVDQLAQFSRALNRREGSLGQLVHDPTLYHRLDRATSNIEELSRKLIPIMNDARILADKLARDPSQLGIRGALARRRPGDGLKYPYLSSRLWQR